ncbi:hypothetical protein [Arthrobacter psychrolactophilus]
MSWPAPATSWLTMEGFACALHEVHAAEELSADRLQGRTAHSCQMSRGENIRIRTTRYGVLVWVLVAGVDAHLMHDVRFATSFVA